MLIPVFLTLLLLALQPICLLYTRSVMEAAAAQTARLMTTADAESEESCRAFALRRLAAVPDFSIFHAGGPLSWDIDLRFDVGNGTSRVSIVGYATPLPVLGAFAGVVGATNAQGDVELAVEVAYEGRPTWLEGSYEIWIERWD